MAAGLVIGAASSGSAEQRPVTVTAPSPAEQHFTQRVSYVDLDLASKAGKRALLRRISVAARQVCLPAAYDMLLSSDEEGDCIHAALSGARPQVDKAIARSAQLAANGQSPIPAAAILVSASI